MDSEEAKPTVKKAPLTIASVKALLTSQPQVRELLEKSSVFWKEYGFKVKIGGAVIGVMIVALIAIRIGQNISAINQPQQAQVSAIPTVQPTVVISKPSVFDGLKTQVTDFTTLLPDPAPPAVDPNISLNPPQR